MIALAGILAAVGDIMEGGWGVVGGRRERKHHTPEHDREANATGRSRR
jgi:hypothetical protein